METTSYNLSEISAISFTCKECKSVLHIAMGTALSPYDRADDWHCPACQAGESDPMQAINELQETVQRIRGRHPEIGIVIESGR
jgi:hypothetical protein